MCFMHTLNRWVIPIALVLFLIIVIAYYGIKVAQRATLPTVGMLSMQVKAKDPKTVVVTGTYTYSNSTINMNPSVTVLISNNAASPLAFGRGEKSACTVVGNAVRCPIASRQRGNNQSFSVTLVSQSPMTQCFRFDAIASTGETARVQIYCGKNK